jgi:hypothetical protein
MGTNVAALWQKAVKLLQDCSTRQNNSAASASAILLQQNNSAEAQSAVQSVQDLMKKLDELPTPPKAVLKKIVQQLQVWCAQDVQLCCCRSCEPLGLHVRSSNLHHNKLHHNDLTFTQ